MTFSDVVMECFRDREFVHHFDRLMGCGLSASGMTAMVDEATGKRASDMRTFIEFVREVVWERLPRKAGT